MSHLDWTKLVSQGRAKGAGVPWTPEELEALITLERECQIARTRAADYIRAGVLTPEAFHASLKADFKPETLEEREERLLGGAPKFEVVPKAPKTRKTKAKK